MRRKSLSTEKGNITMNPIWYPQTKWGGGDGNHTFKEFINKNTQKRNSKPQPFLKPTIKTT